MRILLGVTGGIAAYKACELVRLLVKEGHEVRVCLTAAGARFVTPLTLAILSGEPVVGANPDRAEWRPTPEVEHIELAKWAELIAVVPATADALGKTANGLADDLLSTVLLAARGHVLWAPAMNHAMWAHPAVVRNVAQLRSFGHLIVHPEEGFLAEGETGVGRLAGLEVIMDEITRLTTPPAKALAGQRVLVTAGPTREDLDPVRMITNRSSGTMGVALATVLRHVGADVHLVLGGDLPAPSGITTTRVRSADDMLAACQDVWAQMDGLIAAAAVADQKPAETSAEKVKKRRGSERLTLVRTPDVLATLSAEGTGQWLVGFAAESENLLAHASGKLARKGLDAILVNDISAGQGFGAQPNSLTPITADGPQDQIGPLPKDQLARAVVTWLDGFLAARSLGR